MKTCKDAKRVVELCAQRDEIHELAADIRMAETIGAYAPHTDRHMRCTPKTFDFTHLADELRDLVKREAAAQIEAIDKKLKALGVVPDEFEEAAPKPEKIDSKKVVQVQYFTKN
jgi:hypothetical protein